MWWKVVRNGAQLSSWYCLSYKLPSPDRCGCHGVERKRELAGLSCFAVDSQDCERERTAR